MRKRDFLFLSLVGVIMLTLIISSVVKGEKEQSIIENRALAGFPEFSLDSFLDTDYQSDLEIALTDQIIYGDRVKLFYNNIKNNNLDMMVSVLKSFEKSKPSLASGDEINTISQSELIDMETRLERERMEKLERERIERIEALKANGRLPDNLTFEIDITPKGSGYFQIDDTQHLIVRKRTTEDADALFESKATNYNELVENYPELSYYSYYIETDVDIDFINGIIDHELVNLFFDKLNPSINKTALYINKPSDYAKYFYKTDHHWDVEGQLKGYQDIIWLVKGEDEETLDIETNLIEGAIYNGSKSRTISDFNTYDDFSVLTSELPHHEVYINGAKSSYGSKSRYVEGRFSKEKGVNHYGIANGGDFGLVEYRFNQPDKENMLVFVESFSNPINEFIASHFNNTYLVDLRYYEKAYDKKFDFGDFVESNDIDNVLFTGYYFFYANDVFLIKD
ncbi:MAG: hypothetical protein RIN55_10495 [Tissierellaceae bacterium]|nr:hypothetical protein [Tissierellaceae bacterium]